MDPKQPDYDTNKPRGKWQHSAAWGSLALVLLAVSAFVIIYYMDFAQAKGLDMTSDTSAIVSTALALAAGLGIVFFCVRLLLNFA
jgi:hypothetical protein